MSLQHKTDAEIIETAKKLAGYSEACAVLKELVKRWQVQRELSEQQHQQSLTLAAECDLIRQHARKQSDAVSEVIKLLSDNSAPVSPVTLAVSIEKLVPPLMLDNAVNQLRATEVVDLQSALANKLSESGRIQQLDNLDLMALSHCIDSVISQRLAELLYLPIGPAPVERDEVGYWTHPAAALQPDRDESTPPAEINDWFRSHGLEVKVVDLSDQDDVLFERCMDDVAAVEEWNPIPPEGEDWFLFSIFDSEEGVHAEFVHPAAV